MSTEFEFMGPYFGPAVIPIALPVLVWSSAFYCNGARGWPAFPSAIPTLEVAAAAAVAALPTWADVQGSFSWEALAIYTGWWLFQAALYLLVPGEEQQGVQLRDGKRLRYPINGWRCLLLTAAAAAALQVWQPFGKAYTLLWIADNYLQLATSSIVFATALSVYLYVASFREGALLALGGNSGIVPYDFFIGRELNPRVRLGSMELDLKYFCELRPGLFLWVLINAAMVLKQIELTGSVDLSMAIVVSMQLLYVMDSVYCESCILTTMDIIVDGFGFMLAFGDLAWVPAMYSLQARFLSTNPLYPSSAYAALCVAVSLLGFYIFRASNAEKDRFKTDKDAPEFASA